MTELDPIFIGGTGRCGTTILNRVLNLHPRIFCLRWETQFIVAPGGLINLASGGWAADDLENFIEQLRTRWFHRSVKRNDSHAYAAGLSYDVTGQELEESIRYLRRSVPRARGGMAYTIAARFVDHLFAPAVQRAGAHRWCEKTPRSILYVDKLAEMYPNMRFVHIIRDGRDVAASMISHGFWPIAGSGEFEHLHKYTGRVSLDAAAHYWVDLLEAGRQSAARAPKACYIEVKFEDLVEKPREVLASICDFVGENFAEELLEQKFDKHNMGRWKDEFSDEEASRFDEIAATALRREGYA